MPRVATADGLPAQREPGRRSGTAATSLVSAVAVATVLATAVSAAQGDAAWTMARDLPAWLWMALLAAVVAIGAGAWAARTRPAPTGFGMAMAAVGALLPLWAAWSWVPSPMRAGLLAAAPFAVAGAVMVGPRSALGAGATPARRTAAAVLLLSGTASAVHLLAYNPLADPGCVQTCAEVRPVLDAVVTTRTAVAVTGLLTILAAGLGTFAVLARRAGPRPPDGVAVAVLAALVALAGSPVLRWARWSDPTPSVLLTLVGPFAVAAVGAALCAAWVGTVRVRAAIRRLVAGLSGPQTALADLGGAIRGVHFVMPGEARWVDAAGRDVGEHPASSRFLVLSDPSGPVLRLVLAARAERGEVLAALTPSVRLALRNAHLTVLVQDRVAQVQASQRRVVAAADAERRRIERDLHDGAQQHLVSASFHLRVAMARVAPDQVAGLTAAEGAVRDALAHLRRLAHGIFPTVLTEEGLEGALRELVADSAVPATLDVQLDEDPPMYAAMAAYAAAAAALGTVADPSTRTRAHISASRRGGALAVQVRVQGDREAVMTAELSDAADRVGALGGELILHPPSRQETLAGTGSERASPTTPTMSALVTVVIPCES